MWRVPHIEPPELFCGMYHGLFFDCYMKDESQPNWLTKVNTFTKSRIWIFVHFLFSIILLFGSAIQRLAGVGPRGDRVYLCFLVVVLFFFIVDILIRCVAEVDYFVFSLCRRDNERRNSISILHQSNSDNSDTKRTYFCVGSFLFWCDFLSSLSILYDFSLINNNHFDPIVYVITVNGGIQVSF